MNIHEYQGKEILRSYGVSVPDGKPVFSPEEAVKVAKELGQDVIVVKAQIHAGGRGKAGGVKIAKSAEEVKSYAKELFGKVLVTKQTGPEGKKINRLLIESGCKIAKELYLSFTIDRNTAQTVMIGSEAGGMEIEEVASSTPDKIIKEYIDPFIGLAPFQARRMAFKLNIEPSLINKAASLMTGLYKVFVDKDCSLAEINPLVLTQDNNVMALDVKLNFDDSALFRHPDIIALRDETEEDPKEREAAELGLNYVNLGGNVACMVNGAGLAMATVDIIKHYGGEPANFLDVGGQGSAEDDAKAFKIMTADGQAKGIFVNIFGGINKCDIIAEGIIEANKMLELKLPIVVRLDGTNVKEGREILKKANIPNVIMVESMTEGAKKVVELVKNA
ncbi:ADP-forming succinate--CoA ligase subunit beta [Pectinatus haikarae]|uniref:Succinate--CoA ligase [ADP-forming] subunit beta n=1 Tax=Pectinatus haikarae TaxID=349096 RepID=A0ABT9Y6Y5_9FIRM|nr:ADP-forming succinate--CoA ligase subunit beta [Pectinatus haikarae]MDQ0203311.1 succinyl-CoA synthetase beta subunit [Pectinatus haikarae]